MIFIIMGVSGAGKTTVGNKVIDRLGGNFHGAVKIYWRPRLLPNIGKLKFWNPSKEISENLLTKILAHFGVEQRDKNG